MSNLPEHFIYAMAIVGVILAVGWAILPIIVISMNSQMARMHREMIHMRQLMEIPRQAPAAAVRAEPSIGNIHAIR